jgi:(2R)-ethylmalonyl-CoA mutase
MYDGHRPKKSTDKSLSSREGGIIPPEDAIELEKAGVAAVYTPKDFELNRIISDLVKIVERTKAAKNA